MTEATNPETTARDDDRYQSYEADDGSFVVYDGDNGYAWIQSDAAVELPR